MVHTCVRGKDRGIVSSKVSLAMLAVSKDQIVEMSVMERLGPPIGCPAMCTLRLA